MNFEKQLKSGLKKCPLHKFGANYTLIKLNWYQCNKCLGYYKIPSELSEEYKNIKIDYIITGLATTHPKKNARYYFKN